MLKRQRNNKQYTIMVPFKRVFSMQQMIGSIAALLLVLQGSGVRSLQPVQLRASSPGNLRSMQQDVISSSCDWKKVGDVLIGEGQGFELGKSVAFSKDGSTVAVGSPGGVLTDQPSPGRVLIFDVSSNNGLVALGNPIEGGSNGDEAGGAVALSGDGRMIAIGSSRSATSAGPSVGQARVYRFDAALDDWVQLGQDLEGEAEYNYFGSSIALNSDGSILAVGAFGNDSMRGQVRVYQISDNVWLQLGSNLNGLEQDDKFGVSTALSADGFVLVTGSSTHDSNGLVSSGEIATYQYANSTWNQLGSRLGGEFAGDRFGIGVSVSEDGKTIAGGAWLNDDNGPASGHSRVFTLVDDDWEQLGNTIAGEAKDDNAGYLVSLSADGRKLAVGAFGNDGQNGVDSGHVRIFILQDDAWVQVGRDLDGEASGDNFGFSAALSGDGTSIIVGAYRSDGNGIDAGTAQVFTVDFPCPEVQEEQVKEIELTFIGLDVLNDAEISHFESITEEWYEAYYADEKIISQVGIRNVATTLRVRNQDVENGVSVSNTLTYDQNFTFVMINEAADVEPRDILARPFQDNEQLLLYVNLLADNNATFGNIQFPLGPPQLEDTSASDGGISKGAAVGIAVAALMLGLAVTGLYIWRHKGSKQLPVDFADLPVGELIDIPDSEPTTTSMADAATLQPIAVDVLDTEDRLPNSKDYSTYTASSSAGYVKEILERDSSSLEFKDQVRARTSSSFRSRSGGPSYKDQVRTPVQSLQQSSSDGPSFKDQTRDASFRGSTE